MLGLRMGLETAHRHTAALELGLAGPGGLCLPKSRLLFLFGGSSELSSWKTVFVTWGGRGGVREFTAPCKLCYLTHSSSEGRSGRAQSGHFPGEELTPTLILDGNRKLKAGLGGSCLSEQSFRAEAVGPP